jgi:hypothetical protein
VWSRRTQRGATRSWGGVLTEWHTTRRLPPGVAYDRLAAGWAGRVGAQRVHVVTAADLDGQVAAVLGVRPVPAADLGLPAPLPPAYVDVVRRTSEVLAFRVPPEERQHRLDLLVRLLSEPSGARGPLPATGGGDRFALPTSLRDWLRRTGNRTAARLEAGGYVLHGPLATLGRAGGPGRPGRARDRAVLAALVESVLRAQARTGTDRERGTTT